MQLNVEMEQQVHPVFCSALCGVRGNLRKGKKYSINLIYDSGFPRFPHHHHHRQMTLSTNYIAIQRIGTDVKARCAGWPVNIIAVDVRTIVNLYVQFIRSISGHLSPFV